MFNFRNQPKDYKVDRKLLFSDKLLLENYIANAKVPVFDLKQFEYYQAVGINHLNKNLKNQYFSIFLDSSAFNDYPEDEVASNIFSEVSNAMLTIADVKGEKQIEFVSRNFNKLEYNLEQLKNFTKYKFVKADLQILADIVKLEHDFYDI